jgi:signal transduction histidine kinase
MKMADIKDKSGYALGAEMMKVAAEGKIAEVAYKWPRPGSEEPVDKVSFVTKVGDQICGVGYYK